MADRKKLIERLGRVSYYFKSLLAVGWQGDADIYREHRETVRMAIALLKEQEPHVLSREEMIEAGKNHDAVYVEVGNGRCFWGLAVEGIDPPEDKPYNYLGGVLFNVVNADYDMWDGDFYLMCEVYPELEPHPMGWRAWSAKPTPEQMRTVKWNG